MNDNDIIKLKDLQTELDMSIKTMSKFNPHIINYLFAHTYEQIEFHLNKLVNSHQSEFIISNGNDNQVIVPLIKSWIYKFISSSTIKTSKNTINIEDKYSINEIEFNSYISSSEDYILNEIIKLLDISIYKQDHISAQVLIYDYFIKLEKVLEKENGLLKGKEKRMKNRFFILYFQNMDCLLNNSKQTLFYSLLEILSKSYNLLIVGCTYNFNIMNNMEKRVKSRFIYTIIHPSILNIKNIYEIMKIFIFGIKSKNENVENNQNNIINVCEEVDCKENKEIHSKMDIDIDTNQISNIKKTINIEKDIVDNQGKENISENLIVKSNKNQPNSLEISPSNSQSQLENSISMEVLYYILLSNKSFYFLLNKYINIGYSFSYILSKIKIILCEIYIEISNLSNKSIEVNTLSEFISNIIEVRKESEGFSIYYELFKDLPNIHIICLICLFSTKKKMVSYKKSNLITVYNEYTLYSKEVNASFLIDDLQFKKRLQELHNSNLITMTKDEKNDDLFDFSFTQEELIDLFDRLYKEKIGNFDERTYKYYLNVRNIKIYS